MKVVLMSRQAEVAGGTSTTGHVMVFITWLTDIVAAMKRTIQYLSCSSRAISNC